MNALEILLVFAALVLALVFLFRIGFKKPEGGHGCGGHCGCSKSLTQSDADAPPPSRTVANKAGSPGGDR